MVEQKHHIIKICSLFIVFLLFSGITAAQDKEIDPVELKAFLDGVMSAHLNDHNIAGATLSVVQGGEVIFAQGYGYADVENQIAVDAEQTLFRIGSITKLFTWTSIMQLYEQGLLDLDADINTYLNDFQIPATFDEAITLKDLMSHSAGFEDRSFALAAPNAESLIPNGEWLATHMPARVNPPGESSAYSNYGTALAGYIVEQVSGIPYEQYIGENILQVLDMDNTSVREPIPDDFLEAMSKSYSYINGEYVAGDFEYFNIIPAGAISATATDMGNFMIAHLQDGQFGDTRILQEDTAQLMHSTLFQHDPRLNGMAYGFMEWDKNNQHIIGHGGDTPLFHSTMFLVPEENLGVFVSYNSVGGGEVNFSTFMTAFLDHYYPVTEDIPEAATDFSERAARYGGSYRINRSSSSSSEKFFGLFISINVTVVDKMLLVTTPMGLQRYVEVEPLLFEQVGGQDKLVFREDAQGNISHAFLNSITFMGLEKLAWYQVPMFFYSILAVCLLMFITLLIIAPTGFILNRRKSDLPAQTRLAFIARWVAGIASILSLIFIAGLTAMVSDSNAILTGQVSTSATMLTVISLSILVLAIASIIFTVLAWLKGYWTRIERLHYSILTLCLIAFVLTLAYWNVLILKF